MIISIDRENHDHLVLLPVNITKDKFLQNANVRKNSYFYKLLENIYIALTASTINVEEEYRNYYSEYDNFYVFLYHKHSYLHDETVKSILNKIKTKKYKLFRGYMNKLSDYSLSSLMDYSDEFSNKIDNLLKAELYEDKN